MSARTRPKPARMRYAEKELLIVVCMALFLALALQPVFGSLKQQARATKATDRAALYSAVTAK